MSELHFCGWIVLHHMDRPYFVYSFRCCWASSFFPLLGCHQSHCSKSSYTSFLCACGFSVPWSIHLAAKLLSHTANVCLSSQGTTHLFSTTAIPLYIPTNNVWVGGGVLISLQSQQNLFVFIQVLLLYCSTLVLGVRQSDSTFLSLILNLKILL